MIGKKEGKFIRIRSKPFLDQLLAAQQSSTDRISQVASLQVDTNLNEDVLDWEENARRPLRDLLATDFIFVVLTLLLAWILIATAASINKLFA